MNQLLTEFIQLMKSQFQLVHNPQCIQLQIHQTIIGTEIILCNSIQSSHQMKLITHYSKLAIESILHEVFQKYSSLFFLFKSPGNKEQMKYQFITSLFPIDTVVNSPMISSSQKNIQMSIYTTKQSVPFQLFLFQKNEPIMNFDLIEQLVKSFVSLPIDPFIFKNNAFHSSCSLSPIGAIIIECDEIDIHQIIQLFQLTFQSMIQQKQIDVNLIDKLVQAIGNIIQISPNEDFKKECLDMLSNDPLLNLRSWISGALYDNHFKSNK